MTLSGQPLDPPQITPVEAHALAADGAGILLDVREEGEFAAGHAPGALLLPLGVLASGRPLPLAAHVRTVLVICRSSNRSQRAAAILTTRGVTAVNVAGGMRAWALAGLPVITPHGQDGQVI